MRGFTTKYAAANRSDTEKKFGVKLLLAFYKEAPAGCCAVFKQDGYTLMDDQVAAMQTPAIIAQIALWLRNITKAHIVTAAASRDPA